MGKHVGPLKPFTPWAYQERLIEAIVRTPRLNAWAGMGMGKTVSALTAIAEMRALGDLRGPVLVLGPKRVVSDVWPAEAKKWRHLDGVEVQVISGDPERRRAQLNNRAAGVFCINYENLPWLVEALDGLWPFDMVVADESTRLKSFRLGGKGGVRARALARYAHTVTRRWLNLTGTPSPNGLMDLWGQCWFIDQGRRLGRTFGTFKHRYFMVDPRSSPQFPRWKPQPGAMEAITQALEDVTVALRPEHYFDLDEPIVSVLSVKLPTRARHLYRTLEREAFAELAAGTVEAFNAAARFEKCLQVADGAIYTTAGAVEHVHDAKLDALESLFEECAGEPLLVAYNHRFDWPRIKKRFPFARSIQEPGVIDDWNAGKVPMLCAHPASAGHGLNLQDGGCRIVFFSSGWNLEHHDQIIERIGPMRQRQSGHNRPVWVWYIVAEDTVDELTVARRKSKADLQQLLLDRMTTTY